MSGRAQGPFAPPPPAAPPGPHSHPPPAAGTYPPLVQADPYGSLAPRRRRSTAGPLFLAGALATAAVGLAYYAYVLWQHQRMTAVELKTTKGEVARLHKQSLTSNRRVVVLEKENKQGDRKLTAAQARVRDLSAQLAAAEGKLGELQEDRAEIESRLAEFRRYTRAFQRMIDSGKLEISFRRGRMIVELPAKVLFPSGSAELTDEGKESLSEVGKVLRKIRGKRFIVGGHTDNVPISTPQFPSNWALSAGRAVTVAHALIRAGMSPRRLVVAGYGPHDPVASNGRARGRQRNRRIEIILEPKLRDMPGLEQKKK